MADGVSIYMGNVVQTLKGVDKKFASAVRKEIRKAVAEAGSDITAKVKASAAWSSKIPKATSMRANFTARSAGVRIVVNRNRAPYAKAYELGNKGGNKSGGTFLNGTGGVVDKRPFFFSAAEKATPETERRFIAAIDQAIAEAIQ